MTDEIVRTAAALIDGERNKIANLANVAAYLGQVLEDVNWVGFYLDDGDELVLGPFAGNPACIRISFGQGVCGKAASELQSLIVDDVLSFPGHIACDAASRSEIAIPLVVDGHCVGILDVDSPSPARFTADDGKGLERIARLLETGCDW